MSRDATKSTVNRVRRAVMGEIDRRSHALEQLVGKRRARSSNTGLHDLAGWLDGADVDELLGPTDAEHARGKR